MGVITLTKLTPELERNYRASLKKQPEIIQGLLLQRLSDLPVNSRIVTTEPTIEGLVAIKPRQLLNNKYLSIEAISEATDEVTRELIVEVLNIGRRYKGILTNFIPRSKIVTTTLVWLGLIRTTNWYGTTTSSLSSKTTPGSGVELVEYTSSNHRTYRREFIKLLTEHDELNNRFFNQVVGKSLYPVNLKNKESHKTKLSYFVENLVKDPSWLAYLITEEDEDSVLGFIKGRYDRSIKTIFIDFHLPESYRKHHISAVFNKFATILNKRKIKYAVIVSSTADKISNPIYQRWFGDLLGNELMLLH